MTDFLSWYLASSLLGWLTFPLVSRLFPALTDRGYTLARAVGLLLWGWVFWILASLGVLRNDLSGLLFALITLVAVSVWSICAPDASAGVVNHKSEIVSFLKSNLRLLLTTELLFLVAFAFMAFVRASNPEAVATEKPMELAFINATLRSPTFPPNDPWMSGYSISYYHFGYILTAMLARLTGVSGNIAFNLMLALVFALAAVGSYGILYNLLCAYTGRQVDRYTGTQVDAGTSRQTTINPNLSEVEGLRQATSFSDYQSKIVNQKSAIALALLAPLFLLILSNPEGFLEILHLRGWFWSSNPGSSATSTFWQWLNLKDLNQAPEPLLGGLWERLGYWFKEQSWPGLNTWFNEQFAPSRFWWWWRASRVVSDFDLLGNHQEIIDEFPAFSFVLGDLHPHVLALPFNMLGIGVALNIFLGGWRGAINFFEFRPLTPPARAGVRTAPRDFLFAALVLGGLAFLNTWDILVTAALIVGAFILIRVKDDGWGWSRLEDALLLGIPLVATAIVLYLPFYIGFSSQAGGLLPNLVNPTRGAHLWVMWGTLLLPLFVWLIWLTRASKARPRFGSALAWTVGVILFLWAFSWLLGLIARWREPDFVIQYLASQGQFDIASFFRAASLRRLSYIGGLLTIASILWLSISHLLSNANNHHGPTADDLSSTDMQHAIRNTELTSPNPQLLSSDHPSSYEAIFHPSSFVLFLTLLASILILAPDFVYLRDGFGYRINTVFKFYYQAWQLWSLAAAFAIAVLLQNLRGVWNVLWRVLLTLVLIAGLAYPVFAFLKKTDNFNPPFGYTLDSSAHLERETPEDAAAIFYLQSAPLGVVAEAIGGSYSNYARIATHTGLPAVLGWPWHEIQWRGSSAPNGTREVDIQTLYETPNWDTARLILDRYDVRYVVVGLLERTTYDLSESKFQRNLVVLFQAGNTVVYGVP
jgi:uncharacterized membrane protein